MRFALLLLLACREPLEEAEPLSCELATMSYDLVRHVWRVTWVGEKGLCAVEAPTKVEVVRVFEGTRHLCECHTLKEIGL